MKSLLSCSWAVFALRVVCADVCDVCARRGTGISRRLAVLGSKQRHTDKSRPYLTTFSYPVYALVLKYPQMNPLVWILLRSFNSKNVSSKEGYQEDSNCSILEDGPQSGRDVRLSSLKARRTNPRGPLVSSRQDLRNDSSPIDN